ncbi:hypothetical protein SAV31267_007770 [Streptomyces avermitilis]|uniref:Uncharacterized protein n=1 Tax=Streptomyces avermitilis TaxID=33903 RepID=A0A4D4MGX0_STRAX|nr:hypothetical protein SAV31267_007770 [Streptomyces avermitilis]
MPLDILTDLDHGGRWTSLRSAGREWLWRREAPERESVSPGDPFVDAGGLEECIPTVRGTPDHGHAWSRAWSREADRDVIQSDHFTLSRTIRSTTDGAESDYVLTADAGFRFVWAAHALLDLSDRATVHIRDGASARLFPEAAPLLDQAWPKGAAWVEGHWPAPADCDWTSSVRTTAPRSEPSWTLPAAASTTARTVCLWLSKPTGNRYPSLCGATWAASPPHTPIEARVSSRCSAAFSTSPRPAPVTLPAYLPPARCGGG